MQVSDAIVACMVGACCHNPVMHAVCMHDHHPTRSLAVTAPCRLHIAASTEGRTAEHAVLQSAAKLYCWRYSAQAKILVTATQLLLPPPCVAHTHTHTHTHTYIHLHQQACCMIVSADTAAYVMG
eukprot:GHRR01006480.1.p1 GENE.GHRR01006480.1~~GHRR01006480.1.p1  ORF type:complete len:125 (-),score=35.36 GHRR01006480.1:720-1094(-)